MQKDNRPYHILIVEDNPGDFLLIEEYLEEYILSPQIYNAKNAKEAIAYIQKHEKQLDIIMLDLSLPDRSGSELVKLVMQYCPTCPVIVLTGFSDVQSSVKSLELGASDYLLKDELTPITLYKSLIYNIERTKYVDKLKASEKRYSDLFHLSPLPMCVFAMDNYAFLDVNKAMVEHYGYSRDEFLQMNLVDIRPEEDKPYFYEVMDRVQKDKENNFQDVGVITHIHKDGHGMKMEIRSSPLVMEDGRKARLALCIDVTERLSHIKAIEEKNQKLQEIAWTQSHVVRAPLARVMGFAYILSELKKKELQPEVLEMLEFIKVASEELDHVIKKIVDTTNME